MQMREVFLLFDRQTAFSVKELYSKKNDGAMVDRAQLTTLFLEDECPTPEQLDEILSLQGIQKDDAISCRRYE